MIAERRSADLPASATIDLDAYGRNLAMLRHLVAPAELMAVVKSEAYGHGLEPMIQAAQLAGIDWFGALDIPTALRVRAVLPGASIFAWLPGPDEPYETAVAASVDLGVSTIRQLEQIGSVHADRPASVHLKIDTGLHRNGATESEWPMLVTRAIDLERSGALTLRGIWTHISEASEEEDSASIVAFEAALGVAGRLGARVPLRHLAASSAAYSRPDARFDMVRIGAFGYGIAPGGGIGPAQLALEPVMTVSASVFDVRDGRAYLAIGTGDGISSASVGSGTVAIAGVQYPIIEVGLDWTGILTGEAAVHPGQRAVLFGPGTQGEATLQEWADAMGTIGEEIVTRLDPRLPRTYVGR